MRNRIRRLIRESFRLNRGQVAVLRRVADRADDGGGTKQQRVARGPRRTVAATGSIEVTRPSRHNAGPFLIPRLFTGPATRVVADARGCVEVKRRAAAAPATASTKPDYDEHPPVPVLCALRDRILSLASMAAGLRVEAAARQRRPGAGCDRQRPPRRRRPFRRDVPSAASAASAATRDAASTPAAADERAGQRIEIRTDVLHAVIDTRGGNLVAGRPARLSARSERPQQTGAPARRHGRSVSSSRRPGWSATPRRRRTTRRCSARKRPTTRWPTAPTRSKCR